MSSSVSRPSHCAYSNANARMGLTRQLMVCAPYSNARSGEVHHYFLERLPQTLMFWRTVVNVDYKNFDWTYLTAIYTCHVPLPRCGHEGGCVVQQTDWEQPTLNDSPKRAHLILHDNYYIVRW